MGPLWSRLGVTASASRCCPPRDEESEADLVVRRALALHAQGLRLRDIAVFYRTNALSRGLERALRLHNVPYDIVGAVEFYERKEVKDLLAFLRVLVNPQDSVSFLRIVNVPTRGLGRLARCAPGPPWALWRAAAPGRAPRGRRPRPAARPRAAFEQLTVAARRPAGHAHRPARGHFPRVVRRTGYLDYLRDPAASAARSQTTSARWARGRRARRLAAPRPARRRRLPAGDRAALGRGQLRPQRRPPRGSR